MILGIGIDIIEVSRIAASHEKFGERFLNRILHPAEISYCLSHKEPAPFLAARFAARKRFQKRSAPASARNLAGGTWKLGARKAANHL
jgi:holo-[acyl-carrier protein] synthase